MRSPSAYANGGGKLTSSPVENWRLASDDPRLEATASRPSMIIMTKRLSGHACGFTKCSYRRRKAANGSRTQLHGTLISAERQPMGTEPALILETTLALNRIPRSANQHVFALFCPGTPRPRTIKTKALIIPGMSGSKSIRASTSEKSGAGSGDMLATANSE